MVSRITGQTKTVESKFNGAQLTKNQKLAQGQVVGGLTVSRTTSGDIAGVAAGAVTGGASALVSAEDEDEDDDGDE